jgi:phage terminase large subunit-like protein
MAKRKPKINLEVADRAAAFFPKHLTHTKGRWAGTRFDLLPWQDLFVRQLFGTVDSAGLRLYRKAYVEIPKKNGKSEIAAGIALKLLLADGEQGGEVYSAAADKEQAAIVFNVAAQMVRNSRALSKRCQIIDSQKRIIVPKTGSVYRVLSSDVKTKHGFNASGVIFDELHAQPTRDLYEVLTEGSGDARAQPLFVFLTTAGHDRESICWEVHEYADKVLKGVIDDPNFLAVMYSVGEDENWEDERNWLKANPSMGSAKDVAEGRAILDIDKLRAAYREAKQVPAKQNAFRRLRLNQWTQQVDRFIDLQVWNDNAGIVDETKLRGRTCYGGLDLAAVSDIVAWVMVFPKDDDPEKIDVLCRFWCPQSRLEDSSNKYRSSYQKWADAGVLTPIKGNAVDYSFVKRKILEDASTFRIPDLNVDRLFQAHQLSMELEDEGLQIVGMGQGFMSMAAPMAEFYRRLLIGKINHGANPLLTWMADGAVVANDAVGNMKFDKANSQVKIDGLVALVMALDRAMRHTKRSVYEERGIITL